MKKKINIFGYKYIYFKFEGLNVLLLSEKSAGNSHTAEHKGRKYLYKEQLVATITVSFIIYSFNKYLLFYICVDM